jgi:Tfp pilus assembly protein PilF
MATYTADLRACERANANENWKAFGPTLLVLTAAILPYVGSLQYGFVYDDHDQIVATPIVRSWNFVSSYFLKPSPLFIARYYRPAFFLWLRLNYSLWHTHAWEWHLTNILLHVAVSLLVLAILRRYFLDVRCAVAGALVFAVHPAHVETVAWLSGCTDALMALGLLGALLLWMKYREAPSIALHIGSLVCCAFALLTKETAIIAPLLIIVHALTGVPFGEVRSQRAVNRLSLASREAVPYVGLAVVYLVVRHLVLRAAPGTPHWIFPTHATLSLPSLLLFYIRHLIWPVAGSAFYDLPIVSRASDPLFWALLIVLAGTATLVWICFRRSRDARVLIASCWFLLPLIPVLDIRPFRLGDFAHDRYLYLSVLGGSIAVGLLLEFLRKREEHSARPWLPLALIAALVVSLALASAVQARPWKDNLTLFTNAVQIAPRNPMARNDLGSEYSTEGHYDKAAGVFRELVNDYPDWWMANHNYGYVNLKLGNFAVADVYLKRAIQLDPADADHYVDLGVSYLQEGRLRDAAEELRQSLARDPDGVGYHLILGLVLREQGDLAAARQEILTELNMHPDNQSARDDLRKLDGEMASASH